jgi:hypothetical protein
MRRNRSGERLPTICFVITANDWDFMLTSLRSLPFECTDSIRKRESFIVTDEPSSRAIDRASDALANIAR